MFPSKWPSGSALGSVLGSTGSSPGRILAAEKIFSGQRLATVPRARISRDAQKLARTSCGTRKYLDQKNL